MGQYSKAIITAAGQSLIAKAIAGEAQLNITKAKTSDYKYPDDTDYKALTDMEGIKQVLDSPETKVLSNDLIQTRVLFSNEEIKTTYYIHNIGLYANDGTKEVLFCIVNAAIPDEMPQYNGVAATSYIYNIQNAIQDAETIHITVSPAGNATIQDVMERVDGIGGDISETVIETLEPIDTKYPVPSAGETTKVFMGKVKKYIEDTNPLNADLVVYVATTGSDITGAGTSEKPYETITYALSKIPRNLGGHAVTILIANGVYDEEVVFSGYGNGVIETKSLSSPTVLSNNCKIKKIKLENSTAMLQFFGIYFMQTNDTAFSTVSCTTVYLDSCQSIEYAPDSFAFDFIYSKVRMFNCKSLNHSICMRAYGSEVASTNWQESSALHYGLMTDTGGIVAKIGMQPTGSISNEYTVDAGVLVSSFGAKIGTISENTTLYVATTGSDTTGTGSNSKPFATIQHALDILPKDLGSRYVTINVAVGTYDEDIRVDGFRNGDLNIFSANKNTLVDTCKIRSVIFYCCGPAYVRLNGFNMITTTKNAIQIGECDGVYIDYCQSLTDAGGRTGIQCYESSHIGVGNCKMANKNHGASFLFSTAMVSHWAPGSSNNYIGISSINGSRVALIGAQPTSSMGVLYDRYQENGGIFTYENGTQISDIISSGLSCTWGVIQGGYVRHGNVNGVAMITICTRIITTVQLNSYTNYVINGYPKPMNINHSVTTNLPSATRNCYLSTTNGSLNVQMTMVVVASDVLEFNCTYITNS